ncbi:uncharacterized protein LOC120341475 [Styela clava]
MDKNTEIKKEKVNSKNVNKKQFSGLKKPKYQLNDTQTKQRGVTRTRRISSTKKSETPNGIIPPKYYENSPGNRKQYLWKENSNYHNNERTASYRSIKNLHSSNNVSSSSILGHNVSSENSLHAVQQKPALPAVVNESPKKCHVQAKGQDLTEDVVLKPSDRANSLLEQLLDSKSNRMLQSINPTVETIPTRNSYSPSAPKAENGTGMTPNGVIKHSNENPAPQTKICEQKSPVPSLDLKQNGNVRRRSSKDTLNGEVAKCDNKITPRENGLPPGIKRTSRTVFPGKMEILPESDSDSGKDSHRFERKRHSHRKSMSKSSKSKNSTDADEGAKGLDRQSSLHAAANGLDDVTFAIEERISGEYESSKDEAPNKETPRYMTTICRNHDGRNSGEKLDAVLFCRICVQAVCYKCAFERHKEHDVIPLASAVNLIRVKMAEQKRAIEGSISQMRGRRKKMESNSEEVRKKIKSQFEKVIDRLHEKEDEIMSALDKARQDRLGSLYRLQSRQETCWGQIDAVLKTTDDVKMFEEFSSLSPDTINLGPGSPASHTSCLSPVIVSPRVSVDLHKLQEEIDKIRLLNDEDSSSSGVTPGVNAANDSSRKKKKLCFKLDVTTAGIALRISPNCTIVEYVGSARSSVAQNQPIHIHPPTHGSTMNNSHPYPGVAAMRLRRTQFATVLSDTSITQGKQYWEVSVNRSMEYRLGVGYKHMQGTKTLADEHNSWALCLTYPDRFSAMHKGRKEYIFVASHIANSSKIMRIGLFLDYEKGILSFYNSSNPAEKRHLYTFRTFFNRPVWPLISLRQGKLQIITGLPIPKNLVWKTR